MTQAIERDLGPLTWVKGEIDNALARATEGLDQAASADDAAARVQFAQTHLHQARGALSIVGLDGLTQFAEALDQLLGRASRGDIAIDDTLLGLGRRSLSALGNYLEELVHGATDQALRLAGLYEEIQRQRGLKGDFGADLFFPDLGRRPPRRERLAAGGDTQGLAALRELRARFEHGLLRWLRAPADPTGATAMRDAVAGIEEALSTTPARGLWWAAIALFESLASGETAPSPTIKKLCAQIDAQLRRTVAGNPAVPDRLMRELLYQIAIAPATTPQQRAVRETWSLDGLMPEPGSAVSDTPLGPLLQTLRNKLSAAKDTWDDFSNGNTAALTRLQAQLTELARQAEGLGRPPFLRLLAGLNNYVQWQARNPAQITEALSLEVATALLLGDASLERGGPDPTFSGQVADTLKRIAALIRGDEVEAAEHSATTLGARRNQERDAVAQLSREILSSLAHVEQALDDFFRNPEKRAPLASLAGPLHQVEGALSLVGDDDAIALVRDAAAEIAALAASTDTPDEAQAGQLAHRLSALGFYIQSLQHGPANLARFLDPARAAAEAAALARQAEEEAAAAAAALLAEAAPRSAPAQAHSAASAEPAAIVEAPQGALPEAAPAAVATSPEPAAPTQDEALPAAETTATLDTEAPQEDQAAAAGDEATTALDDLDEVGAEDRALLDEALQTESGTGYAATPAPAAVPAPAPDTQRLIQASEAEIDAELLEIFIEEAHEVLASIAEHLELSRTEPSNAEYFTAIRRGFHTLKGSGRMVGLRDFGEAAWGLEQTLNRWLQLDWTPTPALHHLVDAAHQSFAAWVTQLEQGGPQAREVQALMAEAERLRASEAPIHDPAPIAESAEPAALAPPIDDLSDSAETVFDFDLSLSDDGEILPVGHDHVETEVTAAPPPTAQSTQVAAGPDSGDDSAAPAPDQDLPTSDMQTGVVETESDETEFIDLDILPLPAEEALPAELSAADFDLPPEAPAPAGEDDTALALRAALDAPEPPSIESDLAEMRLDEFDFELDGLTVEDHTTPAPAPGNTDEDATLILPEEPLALQDGEDTAVLDLDIQLPPTDLALQAALSEPPACAPVPSAPAAETTADIPAVEAAAAPTTEEPAAEPAEDNPPPAPEAAASTPDTASAESDQVRIGDAEISRPLYDLYLAETRHHLATLRQELDRLASNPTLLPPEVAIRAAHTLAGISGTARMPPLQALARALEHAQARSRDNQIAPTPEQTALLQSTLETLEAMFAQVSERDMPLPVPELIEQLETVGRPHEDEFASLIADPGIQQAVEQASAPPAEVAAPPPPAPVHDEIDEQLLPIFLEEGAELLHELHSTLRAWRSEPAQAEHPKRIARQLHTLKGSARMTGAMRLGEHVHQMESTFESQRKANLPAETLIDQIEGAVDYVEQCMDAMASGQPTPEPHAPSPLPAAGTAPEATAAPAAGPSAATPSREVAEPAAETESSAGSATLRVRADAVDSFVNQAGEIGIARTRIEGELRTLRRSLLDLTENVIRLRNQLREVEIQAEVQMQSRIAQAESHHSEFDPLEMDRYTRLQELTRMMAESVNDVTTVQQNLLKNLDGADVALHSQARMSRELQQALMQVRMVPFDSLADRLYRVVRQSAKDLGKRATLDLRGGRIELDRSVLEHMVAPLEHLLRNSVAHGIESAEARRAAGKAEIGEIVISVRQEGSEVSIELADDGSGLDFHRIAEKARAAGLLGPDEHADEKRLTNLIFVPGFSTAGSVSTVSGRGVGMDVVKSETAALGGRIEVSSSASDGTRFRIYLPLTLAVTQALLVRGCGRSWAIPSTMIAQVMELKTDALERLRADGGIDWQDQRYTYRYLPRLLGDTHTQPEVQRFNWVLLLRAGSQTLALHVDALRGNQEIVVKSAGPQVARMVGISGATVLGDGEVVFIINPVALASRGLSDNEAAPDSIQPQSAAPAPARIPTVMVVDDSLTVRKITTRLLEREGYRVLTAKDGVDALEKLLETLPDVVLSDIEMPRMDGFDLVRNIRADERTRALPVVMITSRLADKHRQYAMELGANHYLGKPFQEEELLGLLAGYTGRNP